MIAITSTNYENYPPSGMVSVHLIRFEPNYVLCILTHALILIFVGAFDRKVLSRFEVEERQDFDIRTICSENDVYTGQLFSIEQCEQLNRMSEHHAYKQIGTINSGWTDQIYTLTAQHMACKVSGQCIYLHSFSLS